jgi:ribosomal protein S18 acetylase RimI-like enzyme
MKIRSAESKDARKIAEYIVLAMNDLAYKFSNSTDKEFTLSLFEKFVAKEANQYSFENTLVAEENGEIIGAIIGYDGGKLDELRKPFVEYLYLNCGFEGNPEDETEAGEVYLDTLAVSPQHQGKKIGQKLMEALIEQSRERGFSKVGLLVDPDNPPAKRLYERIGFQVAGLKPLLGTTYEHMVYDLSEPR